MCVFRWLHLVGPIANKVYGLFYNTPLRDVANDLLFILKKDCNKYNQRFRWCQILFF